MEDSLSPDAVEKFFLNRGFATRALHAGEKIGQPHSKAHTNAIFQTSTFYFDNVEEGAEIFAGKREGYVYTRMGNPTVVVLEAKMNALEGREVKLRDPYNTRVTSIVFSSGMAAITSTLLAILRSGDTLIAGDTLYGATDNLLAVDLPAYGINAVRVDTSDLAAVESVMKAHPKARAIFFETPTNPTMKITDIEAVVNIARASNPEIYAVVDNTFATPYLQRPLSLGADVVIHSTTKYICGHGTVVGGVTTTTREELKNQLYHVVKNYGCSPSPFDTWLVNMGLKTLPLRMERHCENALAIARFLEAQPQVERVDYPGLESFPQYELAKKQMSGFGGMISFTLKGGLAAGKQLMDSVKIFTLAVSLGCVDSLIQHPASMTHAMISEAVRMKTGITDGLVRASIGLEDVDDLIEDLSQGLENIKA